MKARVGFLALSLSLSACGGGNGGGVPAFTGWSAIQPGSTVAAKGVSQDAAYSYSPVTGKVVAIGGLLVLTDSSANVTLDADGFLSKLVLETPATTLNFDLFADLGTGLSRPPTPLSSPPRSSPIPISLATNIRPSAFGIPMQPPLTASQAPSVQVHPPLDRTYQPPARPVSPAILPASTSTRMEMRISPLAR